MYPLTTCNFLVEIDGMVSIGFSEVNGLSASVDVIDFKEGSSPENAVVKLPGLRKFSNVTLKRGIVKGNNEFYNWFASSQEKADRRNVAIKLLDEEKNLVMQWLLYNAFPAKISYSGLNASANELVLEELELAYENLKVEML
ncbi:MAG: phage tail protein [Parafilimonas sp.]